MRHFTEVLRVLTFVLLAGCASMLPGALFAQTADPGWPREITMDKGSIIVYQPQAESLKGDILTGRAAMALKLNGKTEPVFGAFWFKARVNTDTDARTATLTDVDVTRVRWTDATPEQQEALSKLVESRVPEAGWPMSMDRLSASLATAEREAKSVAELKNEPPKIIFTYELSVLLLYDGEPRYEKVGDSPYERISNTPMLVVRESKSEKYLLSGGNVWYSAGNPKGPWQPGAEPPKELLAMLPPDSVTRCSKAHQAAKDRCGHRTHRARRLRRRSRVGIPSGGGPVVCDKHPVGGDPRAGIEQHLPVDLRPLVQEPLEQRTVDICPG